MNTTATFINTNPQPLTQISTTNYAKQHTKNTYLHLAEELTQLRADNETQFNSSQHYMHSHVDGELVMAVGSLGARLSHLLHCHKEEG